MAVLIVKRIYKGEIVELRTATMRLMPARAKLQEIAKFPGQVVASVNDAHGELWIEVENRNGDLDTDPVCFTPDTAHAALVRTGMPADEATRLLSDAYAEEWLTEYYAANNMQWSAV